MIEVFKTNVQKAKQAKVVTAVLIEQFPGFKVNFDLDDCDKILRVESSNGAINYSFITGLVKRLGYEIETLPD
jgi:hypothetical protein